MKKKLRFALGKIMICNIILLLFLPLTAMAQTVSPPNGSYNIPFINNDQTLNMPKNSVSYWFFMPRGGEIVDECTLNVHFTFSSTLIDNRSSLTILVNGTPLDTKGIYTLQQEGNGWWNVKLPASKIRQNNMNEIKFTSDQRSIEGDCADIDNPDNWVMLHRDSYLNIAMKSFYDAELSGFYPIYYEGLTNQSVLSTDFVMPAEGMFDSLPSLFKLCSSIGKNYRDKRALDFHVLKEDFADGTQATVPPLARNKVYIGLLSGWKNQQTLTSLASTLTTDQGYLSISGPSEDAPYYSTVIGGTDRGGLNKAVNFMTNRVLLEQANQSSITLNSPVQRTSDSLPFNKEGVYLFSDFGYQTINLAGAFHQKAYLTFIQPQEIKSAKGSYINLKLSHSKALVSDRSVITVTINGTTVTSTKLTVANADEGTLKVTIPEKALASPVIELSIDCYNYLGVVDCSKDYSDSAWTVIDDTSQIVLYPGEVMLQPTLKTFPYFYPAPDQNKTQVALGLMKEPDQNSVELAALLATRLGQNTGHVYEWSMLENHDPTEEQKGMDMVFIGSYQTIKLPEAIKTALAVAPQENGQLEIQSGVDAIAETLQNKGLFQVIRSPWNQTRRIYVVLYNNQNEMATLKQALLDKEVLQKMDKQFSLVSSNLDVTNLEYASSAPVSVPKTTEDRLKDLERITHMPWWLVLALVILIFAALIALLRLRRVKDEFIQAGEKMKTDQGFMEGKETGEDGTDRKDGKEQIEEIENNHREEE